MTARGRGGAGDGGRERVRRVGPTWPIVLAGLWWILAPPAPGFIAAGLAAVAIGTLFHAALGAGTGDRISPLGLAVFVPWFARLAVRGGIDVARRALSPSLPLSPALLPYPLRIPPGAPRVFFVNAISLLPGTFSTDLQGDELTVHLLARGAADEAGLRTLEARVAALWRIRLSEGGGRA